MNKTAIKNFAIWARVNLIESAKQRAYEYEITDGGQNNPNAEIIAGRPLSRNEQNQRKQLIEQIRIKGFNQVMEEAAYTWFNRFIALRYMEVNGYLPTRIRVFTNEEGEFKPEILKEAMTVELDGLDRDKVLDLLDKQDNEALYKMLLIAQCNSLSTGLPYMFEKIANWTELLFPANLLKADSVIGQMVSAIPEDDWTDAVQIIGWMYQYYNSELKDETFDLLAKKVKITKERIPAATQLFTPDWIVRYMVENSLGRIYIQRKLVNSGDWLVADETTKAVMEKQEAEAMGWKYYLPEAEQDSAVREQLIVISNSYTGIRVEDIKVIDPCMGSGHILVYAFDVLMQIYVASGWSERDAAKSILENNLYGLDIDDRAGQLAYFAVMMKARKYNRRILNGDIHPNVMAIQDSSFMTDELIGYVAAGNRDIRTALTEIRKTFTDAKEYGSILNVKPVNTRTIYQRIEEIEASTPEDLFAMQNRDIAIGSLWLLVKQTEIMARKYDAVVTNPPYMAMGNAGVKISDYVKNNYPDSKADLFAVFIEKCNSIAAKNGFVAMITQHTWMFLGSYEKLRDKLQHRNLVSLTHLGIKAFEEIGNDVVQTATFIINNTWIKNRRAVFTRLVDYKDYAQKEAEFFNSNNRYVQNTSVFNEIPGFTYAYWVGDSFVSNFKTGNSIEAFGEFTGSQNITGNNDKYLRYFWEVNAEDINTSHWVFYAKGGDYRKYYGNLQMLIDWRSSARNFYATNKTSNLLNEHFWFKEGITYSAVTSRGTGFRYLPENCIFDKGGPSIVVKKRLLEILALLNSKVAETYFQVLNPSINLQVKDIKALPVILPDNDRVETLTRETLSIAREDWNSLETSYEFTRHPLINGEKGLRAAFSKWERHQQERFECVRANETEVNKVFCSLYGMENLSIDFEERDLPVRLPDTTSCVKSFISFAVGCMFGRYSLDTEGIVFAGGNWDANRYISYKPDEDNIIPICDDEYFNDDLVGRFVSFVEAVYGKETLEDSLQFIAEALGGSGTSRSVIRNYFLNEFFADHCSMYSVTGSGKRPIYWLFDSGKKNGFKCLIYMHRYQSDTIARIRTDYIHELQSRYRTAIADLEDRVEHAAASERVKLSKQLAKIKDQELELRKYEEKIHHLADQMIEIDLDDGVKVNYAKFGDVLAKIK